MMTKEELIKQKQLLEMLLHRNQSVILYEATQNAIKVLNREIKWIVDNE